MAPLGPSQLPAPISSTRLRTPRGVSSRDEAHSLGLASERRARDDELRRSLGRTAFEYWRTEHTLERAAEDYLAAIDATIRTGAEDPGLPRSHDLPAHPRHDGGEQAREILTAFGLEERSLWGAR